MDKMMKAMELIRQGMAMAEQAMEESGEKPEMKEEMPDEMSEEMPASEGMDDKKKMIVAMLKKKGM